MWGRLLNYNFDRKYTSACRIKKFEDRCVDRNNKILESKHF